MCQAKVFLLRGGDRELLMDEVSNLWVEDNTVWVSQLLEEPVAVRARIEAADFLKHTVTLVVLDDEKRRSMTDTKDVEKLRALLPHWIRHNAEHAAEFRRWAQRAGQADVYLQTAADRCEGVNAALERALEQLGGPPETEAEPRHEALPGASE
jgi:predicted RNA-binding protein